MSEGSGIATFQLAGVGRIQLGPGGVFLLDTPGLSTADRIYWQRTLEELVQRLDNQHATARELLPKLTARLGLPVDNIEITGETVQPGPPPESIS